VWVLEFEQGLLKAALQQELQPSIRPERYGSGAFKQNRSSDTLIASSGRRLRLTDFEARKAPALAERMNRSPSLANNSFSLPSVR
jgi:hypothetical protein